MQSDEKINAVSWRRIFLFDAMLALFALTFIFLIFIHLLFDPISIELVIFKKNINHGFPNNQVFSWYILNSIIGFAYLTFLFATSFEKWRFLMLPCICYFPCNLLSMYSASDSENYWEYIFSVPGILSVLIVISIVMLMEILVKRHLLTYYIEISFYQIIRELVFSWNKRLNIQIKNLIKRKSTFLEMEYVVGTIYLQKAVEQPNNDIRATTLNFGVVSNKRKFNSIFYGIVLILSTIFFFLKDFLPSNSETLQLGGVVIESYGFEDVRTLVWYTSHKVFLGSAFIVWFITSPYWWRWAVLLPLILYAFQLWEAFQEGLQLESAGNLSVLPLVLATIILVMVIFRVVRTHCITMDYKALLEKELDEGLKKLSKKKDPPAPEE